MVAVAAMIAGLGQILGLCKLGGGKPPDRY
jgi:hypothetical protein